MQVSVSKVFGMTWSGIEPSLPAVVTRAQPQIPFSISRRCAWYSRNLSRAKMLIFFTIIFQKQNKRKSYYVRGRHSSVSGLKDAMQMTVQKICIIAFWSFRRHRATPCQYYLIFDRQFINRTQYKWFSLWRLYRKIIKSAFTNERSKVSHYKRSTQIFATETCVN